jgi:hypothetical protein
MADLERLTMEQPVARMLALDRDRTAPPPVGEAERQSRETV